MKIKFVLGPYGYEVVLGNISEQVYNKYSQDNDALRDAVTGFEEDPEIKEWSDMDDIAHSYGPVLEEEGTDQYLKILDEKNNELLNMPLTLDEIQKKGFKIKGPFPADTIFLKQNRKKFNVIIGMYHDQVLTPIKTLKEYDAINITLGLPFLRVSPDHGPNEKMINKNISNPFSLIKAIEFLDKK